MPKTPAISDAEWEIMNVLWEESPRTATDVAESLKDRVTWNTNTVKTLLGRLVKKGVVRFKPEGNRYLYSPALPRERYVRQESASFLDRVFGGDASPMLVHFVRNSDLSDEEIEELRRILDEKKKEEK